MPKGDSFTFSYKANLAANLEHNKSAYENYIVYFSNKDSQSNLDSAIATKVGVTTGSGAVIKAQIESENNSTTIASGELLKYKLVIENTGTEAATGLKMSIQLKSNMMYVEKDESLALGYKSTGVAEYDSIENSTDKMAKVSLPDIAAHSKLEKEIWIKTQEDSNEEYDFNTKVTISNGDVKAETNSIAEKITRTYFIKNISREIDTIDVGTTNSFTISVASTEFDYSSMVDENSSYEYKGERKNTNVKFNLPEELSIVSVQKGEEDITNTISNKNGEVIIPLGNVTGNTVKLTIMVKAEKINDGYTKEVTIAPSVYADNVAEEQIGTLNIPLSKPGLEIKQTSDIPSSIKINAAERYTYTFTIKNPSKSVIGGIDFVDYLPKELTYSGMEVQVDNGTISSKARLDENGNPTTQIGFLNGGAEAVIKVHVVAAPEESDYTVVNKASISQERIGTIESNEITTIVQNINKSRTNMVLGKKNIILSGKGYIEDVLCKNRFRISPDSFYQINPSQTEKLYKAAIKMSGVKKDDVVLDAYCGIGTIGITMAKYCREVIGVELNSAAVNDAVYNAKLNNISNIHFICQDAGEYMSDNYNILKANVVVMDPPRAGLDINFLNSVIRLSPERIIYISCNPETQARDVLKLMEGGYRITGMETFDLFPYTDNVENIVCMSK